MPNHWVDLTRCSGPDLRDVQSREHMDYTIQKRLCEVLQGGEAFVHVREYRNDAANYKYRTVQDYCDDGDLENLTKRHPEGVPEPLIWCILEQLAKSAIVSLAEGLGLWVLLLVLGFR